LLIDPATRALHPDNEAIFADGICTDGDTTGALCRYRVLNEGSESLSDDDIKKEINTEIKKEYASVA
jgi:hypothetical protein